MYVSILAKDDAVLTYSLPSDLNFPYLKKTNRNVSLLV